MERVCTTYYCEVIKIHLGVFTNGIKPPPGNPMVAPPDSVFVNPNPLQIIITQDLVDDLLYAIATGNNSEYLLSILTIQNRSSVRVHDL